MILGENIESVYSEGREIGQVYSYGKLVWEKGEIDYSVIPFTVRAIDDNVNVGVFKIDDNTGYNIIVDIKYSINGGEWVETTNETGINLNKNDKLSIIASDIDQCAIKGLSDVYGNIMSLIYGDDFIGQTVWTQRTYYYEYEGFFSRSDIRNANNLILPATTLAEYAYEDMFYYCTSLTTAPELPATTLAKYCYQRMFYYCTSLTTAPALPATTLAEGCYKGMFYICESLTTAPALPATTLADSCYYDMFASCTSLTTAPALPATTLADSCYLGMFRVCSSLTTAPALPATTLAVYCYTSMFYSCESLTTAPELPATILANKCYRYMFLGCLSLKYIKCHATIDIEDGVYGGWLNYVKTNGTLVCKQVNGGRNPLEDYIPSTWTVEYFT